MANKVSYKSIEKRMLPHSFKCRGNPETNLAILRAHQRLRRNLVHTE